MPSRFFTLTMPWKIPHAHAPSAHTQNNSGELCECMLRYISARRQASLSYLVLISGRTDVQIKRSAKTTRWLP